MNGLTAPKIEGKLSLRASVTGQIAMDEVEVGESQLLPKAQGVAASFLPFWHDKHKFKNVG